MTTVEGKGECKHNWQRRRDGKWCANCGEVCFGEFVESQSSERDFEKEREIIEGLIHYDQWRDNLLKMAMDCLEQIARKGDNLGISEVLVEHDMAKCCLAVIKDKIAEKIRSGG